MVKIKDIAEQCGLSIASVSKALHGESDLNPNGRIMGYNWYYDKDNLNSGIEVKAYYTTAEIEQSESQKYGDTSYEAKDDYLLKVEMTPAVAAYIREDINAKYINKGSYTNDSVYCEDYIDTSINSETVCNSKTGYTWDNNKCVIKGVLCYSSIIDKLIDEYPEQVIPSPNRKTTANFTEYTIEGITGQKRIMSNGYWWIFPDYASSDVGPSWK